MDNQFEKEQEMDLDKAVSILIESAILSQSKGVFNLDQAVLVHSAIKFLTAQK